MENRYSWQQVAVALFDKATTRLGEDARQLQDAMFWLRRARADDAVPIDAQWDLGTHADPGNP